MSAAQRVQAKTVVFFHNSMFGLLCKSTIIITISKFELAKPQHLSLIQVGKDFSILKIESAHTKDTPRGSTAMMSLEDSERTKSGQYAERNWQEQ